MKIFITVVILAAISFSSICGAQSASEDAKALKAFTVSIPLDACPVWATVVNDRTAQILWRSSPSTESLKSGAAETGLTLYVMGLVTKDFEVTPDYSISQGGVKSAGKAINIKNLSGGTVKKGDILLGLIEFGSKIDLTKSFTIKFSGCSVETSLNPDDVKQWGAITSNQQDMGGPPPGSK